jgi:hypothetical protein
MSVLKPRYEREEFARRGQAIYRDLVLPTLGAGAAGHYVAIDIESGAHEVDRDDFTATQRLLATVPDAQIWLVRVGQPATYRLGGRPRSTSRS